jgi:nitrite reductase (NADH) small subunit
MREILICRSDEIKDGTAHIVEVDNLELGVIRHGGRCYAYRNLCPHQGGPACEGLRLPQVEDVIDGKGVYLQQRFDESDLHIICPWHGYEYHLSTGVHVADPRLRLQEFEVSERDGNIYVRI